MNRIILFIVLTLTFALVISCKAQKQTTETAKPVKLSNEWIFIAFYDSNDSLVYDLSKSAEISISPDEKFFTGNSGCNAMRGQVIAEAPGKIKIGPVESMRKRCANSDIEKKLLEALECVTNYSIEGSFLKLYCNEKPVLQFENSKK